MMKGIVDVPITIIHVDDLYQFDRSRFGIDEMAESDIKQHGISVATQIAAGLRSEADPHTRDQHQG